MKLRLELLLVDLVELCTAAVGLLTLGCWRPVWDLKIQGWFLDRQNERQIDRCFNRTHRTPGDE